MEIPAIVLHLANQVNGTPLAWKVNETNVVIVFMDGRKLTFDREPVTERIEEIKPTRPERKKTSK